MPERITLCRDLISSRWYLVADLHDDGSMKILFHGRHAIPNDEPAGTFSLDETDKPKLRTVVAVQWERYGQRSRTISPVTNPGFVFGYEDTSVIH